jgi:hypothetical protein
MPLQGRRSSFVSSDPTDNIVTVQAAVRETGTHEKTIGILVKYLMRK